MIQATLHRRLHVGHAMHDLLSQLHPLHRTMTGEGVRETFRRIARYIPITLTEVPSGTKVLDWVVPVEWRIRDAFIADTSGKRLVDYRASNLHVVSYSQPVRQRMAWAELEPHLHSLPEHPEWIPYRTSYYKQSWGFCLADAQRRSLAAHPEREYDVVIDAEHFSGSLTFAELYLPGTTTDECLIHTHTCHPSLANDNLSGIVVATWLAKQLANRPHRLSYRFVFAPATIGAITWLAMRRQTLQHIKHGLVLALLGDDRPLTYKESRQGNHEIDQVVRHLLNCRGYVDGVLPFRPMGYDERQFGSPGFDLPVGCLMRSQPGEYAEYHTSADSPEIIRPEQLADALDFCMQIIEALDENRTYRNLRPYGEPFLSRYDLYRSAGEQDNRGRLQEAILWLLNQADGEHDLLSIAQRSGLPIDLLAEAARKLVNYNLLAAE